MKTLIIALTCLFGSFSLSASTVNSQWIIGEDIVEGAAWIIGEDIVEGTAWIIGEDIVEGAAWIIGEDIVEGFTL